MAVGGAWVDLSCVDSANERDYRFKKRTPFVKKAEEGSNNRSVMSFRCSGLHARYNVGRRGLHRRELVQIRKAPRSWDRRL